MNQELHRHYIKKETTQYLDTSGYMELLCAGRTKRSVGTSICSVDETGSLARAGRDRTGTVSLVGFGSVRD